MLQGHGRTRMGKQLDRRQMHRVTPNPATSNGRGWHFRDISSRTYNLSSEEVYAVFVSNEEYNSIE